jgi:predicted enzyme related to lactoylglutathione lyase
VDKVVHFEITAEDLGRAKEFYGSIFGWDLQDVDMGGGQSYTTVSTVPVDDKMMPTEPGAINGGMMQRTAEISSPVITIAVDSIERALKEVEAAGGSIITPRTEIPNMGAYGYFKDTEGNVLGLWETVG